MINLNLKDKDINSGLAMGSTNFKIRAQLLRTSGAGVNADSNMSPGFATCDPLSELVWSSSNGLSLKCANPRADDRKPLLLWNVGPSSGEALSPLQSIIPKPVFDQGNLTMTQTVLVTDDIFNEKASDDGHTVESVPSHGDGSESDRKMEDEADKEGEENCILETDVIAESRDETTGVVPAAPSKKLESSADNDPCSTKNALPAEGSCMSNRICLYQDKGKGKALSDGDIYGRSSDEEDDSHESAESSNSGVSIKGIKRHIYDRDVIIGSKRMKKQIHGSDGVTTIMKPDSSFMKWISNMTKSNNKESLNVPHLACSNDAYSKNDSASMNMGFQTVFQSLQYRETDASKKVVESIGEESREHAADDEKSPCGNSSEHTMLCNKEVDHSLSPSEDPELSRAKDGAVRADPLRVEMKITTKEACPESDVVERSSTRASLWITRLSTKTLMSEKGKEKAEEAIGCSTSCLKADLEDNWVNAERTGESTDSKTNSSMKESINLEASFEVKSISKLRPVPSGRFSSEAMTSVFARRLDALRHITSSKKGKYSTCLFCGDRHDVRECPSVTKSEVEDLLLKLTTFDGRAEESSCLCIRCSKSDHWAVSCPAAPSFGARHLQLYAGSGDDQNAVPKSKIFDAIRNLRLTRADIVRWMNSNVPSSHLNGFFLRLRLGSIEAGLGESSYYVACITGDARENNGCTSKKSILVDVGGIKSSVATQYVSNHDFLEDEIKAWWRRTVGSGCRIPSLAELNSKFNDRQTLGF